MLLLEQSYWALSVEKEGKMGEGGEEKKNMNK